MKDAQAILRHKHIKTTAEVYMDHIPESVRKALDARTNAIFAHRKKNKKKKKSVQRASAAPSRRAARAST